MQQEMRPNRNMTFKTFLECYFLPSKSADWNESTMQQNKGQLRLYVLPVLGMNRLGTISHTALQVFLEEIANRYSLSTLKNLFYIVAGTMRLAKRLGAISFDPTLGLKCPDVIAERGAVATPQQVLKLLSAVVNVQDRSILMLVVFCRLLGNRVFRLRWGDLRGEYLFAKPGAPPMLVPTAVLQAINKWRGRCPDSSSESFMFVSQRGTPFGRPMDFEKRHIYPVADRVGIPDHLVSFQALRRATVSLGLCRELSHDRLSSNPSSNTESNQRRNHETTASEGYRDGPRKGGRELAAIPGGVRR